MGMRTPLSYYGGKQQLAGRILGMIPKHHVYCEPFCGGAAIFFAKEPSGVEIINFYEVLKRDYPALEREIEISLDRMDAGQYLLRLQVERLFWLWPDRRHQQEDGQQTLGLQCRLRNPVTAGANRVLRCLADYPEPGYAGDLFYLDPPYVGYDQGHYDGYTQMDFDALLGLLEGIQGKFPLSSFHNANLKDFTGRNGWHTVELRLSSSMTHSQGRTVRDKVEVLTANYPIKTSEKGRRA